MNEHDTIRELLALAAAGALDAREEQRLQQHLAACPVCAAEMERWHGLTGALRRLPTPQPSAALVARTHAAAVLELQAEAERSWNRNVLLFLGAFASLLTPLAWLVVRAAFGGIRGWPDLQTDLICLTGYAALTWMTAGVAVVMLSLRQRAERRMS